MSPEEVEAAARVLRSGRLVQAEEVRLFEQELAAWLGVKHAVAVSSGTAALHLALLALGVGPGVEVIVPDFTFPATGNVVFLAGAVPVLADVDPVTLCLTTEEVQRRITSRTRAVMPVHCFGYPAAVDAMQAACEEARVSLVEDAAGALGSRLGDRWCGTFGRAGCFSFHPRKALTTGEGGAVVSDDERLAELVRRYRNHGMVSQGGVTRFELAGFNYRLTEMAAAIGRAKIPRLDWTLRRKNEVAARYRELLSGVDEVALPPDAKGGRHSYQAYVVRLRGGVARDAVIRGLADRGVEANLGTYAMHAQPLYQHRLGCHDREYPNSWAAFHDTMAIPLYPELTDDQVVTVANALKEAIAGARA
jgi:perosamine synthetase